LGNPLEEAIYKGTPKNQPPNEKDLRAMVDLSEYVALVKSTASQGHNSQELVADTPSRHIAKQHTVGITNRCAEGTSNRRKRSR
jgi:hypothetical protein